MQYSHERDSMRINTAYGKICEAKQYKSIDFGIMPFLLKGLDDGNFETSHLFKMRLSANGKESMADKLKTIIQSVVNRISTNLKATPASVWNVNVSDGKVYVDDSAVMISNTFSYAIGVFLDDHDTNGRAINVLFAIETDEDEETVNDIINKVIDKTDGMDGFTDGYSVGESADETTNSSGWEHIDTGHEGESGMAQFSANGDLIDFIPDSESETERYIKAAQLASGNGVVEDAAEINNVREPPTSEIIPS